MTTTTFAAALKAMREASGTSQYRLAARLGVDHSSISRWESGDRRPTRENVAAICDALDATPDERTALLESAGFADDVPPDVATFRALPERTRRILLEIAAMMQETAA